MVVENCGCLLKADAKGSRLFVGFHSMWFLAFLLKSKEIPWAFWSKTVFSAKALIGNH